MSVNDLSVSIQQDVHLNTYLQLLKISFSESSVKKFKGYSALTWMSKTVFGEISVVL